MGGIRAVSLWRQLVSDSIGTDKYWSASVLNKSFFDDMRPLIAQYARGCTLDLGAGRLAWRDVLQSYIGNYISGDIAVWHTDQDLIFDATGALPFRDASFDTVFCCSVLEHDPEPWDALVETRRVLTPDGCAIISLPFVLHLHDEPHDYYRFTKYGLKHLATHAGFKVEAIVENGGFFHLLMNPASMIISVLLVKLRLGALLSPISKCWVGIAKFLDGLLGMRKAFASNYIAVLRPK